MEGAQDAEAVLGTERPRLSLELVANTLAKNDSFGGCLQRLLPLGFLLSIGFIGCILPLWVAEVGVLVALAAVAFSLKNSVPARAPETGYLLFFENKLLLYLGEAEQQWPLDAATRVSLRYQGFCHEPLGGRLHASGIDNFIQVNDGLEYAFAVPNEAVQATLRRELRHWYERKVQLREFRRGSRTIFLSKEPSYEQLQAFKKEFGISLYR